VFPMIPGCSFLTKILLLLQIVEPFTSHYVFALGGLRWRKLKDYPTHWSSLRSASPASLSSCWWSFAWAADGHLELVLLPPAMSWNCSYRPPLQLACYHANLVACKVFFPPCILVKNVSSTVCMF
jgi:hypothetical protein